MKARRSTGTVIAIAAIGSWALGSVAEALDPERAITQYVRESWTAHEGAPSGTIKSIVQTPNGYLWLGTDSEGLVRFDGVSFVRTNELDLLFERRVDHVSSLMAGRDGTLWVGTIFGLARLRGGERKSFDGGEARTLYGLHEAPDGTVWYARHWEGIFHVAGDNLTRVDLGHKPLAFAIDSRGTMWVGGYEGLWRIAGNDRRFYSTSDGLMDQWVTALYLDRSGDLWAGSQRGLTLLRGDKVVAHFTTRDGLSDNEITAIYQDRDGVLWVGTAAGGLNRRRGDRFEYLNKAFGLTNNRVTTISEDREGSLWIGTAGGLNRLRNASVVPIGASEGLSAGEAVSIAASGDGSVYMSFGFGGLAQFKDGHIRASSATSVPGSHFDGALFADPDGGVWSGQRDALVYRRDGQGRLYHVKGQVTSIGRDAQSLVFALSGGDLYRLIDGKQEPYRLPNGSPLDPAPLGGYIWMPYLARDGTFWLGTGKGLFAVQNGQLRQVWQSKSYNARSISEDEQGTLWVATHTGVVRVAGESVTLITDTEGLPYRDICSVLSDRQGGIWMSSARGIFRVKRADFEAVAAGRAKSVSAETFGVAEGMRTTAAIGTFEPAGCVARDGRLWFTTGEGVVVIDPARLQHNAQAPPMVIESLVADDKELGLDGGAVARAGSKRVDIHYNGLSLVVPQRVKFQYKLEGSDSGWVDAGTQRVAHYMNLTPGTYAFRVKGCNNDGVWSEESAPLRFTLAAHFWQTWVFDVLLAALLLYAVYLVYRWRVASLHALQLDLTRRVDERTADLTHEIGEHKLTETKLVSENEQRRRAEEEARQYVEKLAESNVEMLAKQEAIARENTERRRAEEEAGWERDLLRALMDNIPDLIYFKDLESRFVRINKAHATAFGLSSPEQAEGKSDFDFHSQAFASHTREDERALMAGGRPLAGRVEQDPRSGRWYLATKVPLKDPSGRVTGLVGVSKDVTDRTRAEEKLAAELAAFREIVSSAARGDLTRRAAESDETVGQVARLVNEMLTGFSSILTEVRATALSVSSSSSEILSASSEIAKGAQYGNEQLQSTSSAVEEMAASMTQVSRNADASAEKARQVLEHVRQGDRSVEAAFQGMTRIDAAVSQTADKMKLLEQRTNEVFEIIGLIEEIASRSTLLSLNAAIEAAHAGDAGRGFSVVAEEVRKLADRSGEATKNVAAIVKAIVEEVKGVLDAMQAAMREVKQGRTLSEQARGSLREVSPLVQDSVNLATQISTASREQAQATTTVADAMQTISNISLESSAGANETSKAVRDLVRLSERLNEAISRFKIDGHFD